MPQVSADVGRRHESGGFRGGKHSTSKRFHATQHLLARRPLHQEVTWVATRKELRNISVFTVFSHLPERTPSLSLGARFRSSAAPTGRGSIGSDLARLFDSTVSSANDVVTEVAAFWHRFTRFAVG